MVEQKFTFMTAYMMAMSSPRIVLLRCYRGTPYPSTRVSSNDLPDKVYLYIRARIYRFRVGPAPHTHLQNSYRILVVVNVEESIYSPLLGCFAGIIFIKGKSAQFQ